jgi:hypothetical protein
MTEANRITPADIESKFREIQGQVDAATEEGKQKLLPVLVGGGLLLLLLVFLFGRRSGRRRSTVVQIRRI